MPELKAQIEDILDESITVKRFYLVLPEVDSFFFQPGQFVTIKTEIDGNRVERSYSIANMPDLSNRFELCIVLSPDGALSPELWKLKRGDVLNVEGPLGGFVLREPVETELCFICTGTGVAPFRSMIRHLLINELPHQRIRLIFGARYESDLLYRKEFEELAFQFPEFEYIPVLSREKWSGETGYVHQVYQKLYQDGRDARFYVCGWQAMCAEARNHLKDLGYNRRQYFFEQYDG